jgi:hypothetical protein
MATLILTRNNEGILKPGNCELGRVDFFRSEVVKLRSFKRYNGNLSFDNLSRDNLSRDNLSHVIKATSCRGTSFHYIV